MAQPYSFGSRPIFPEHLPKGNAAPQFKSRALEKQMKYLGPSPSLEDRLGGDAKT